MCCRHDMSKPQDYYWSDHIARSLKDIMKCVKQQTYSCQHMPLVNIPLENVILYELHLMLQITGSKSITSMYVYIIVGLIVYVRTLLCTIHCFCVSDKLIKNLVEAALEWDKKDNINKAPSKRCNKHLEDLVETVRNCGVWEKPNGDGSGNGLHDFTSPTGSAKKLLLKRLPDNLKGIIKPGTDDNIIKLWKVQ